MVKFQGFKILRQLCVISTCDPALNAMNPATRMNPPRVMRGKECPGRYSVDASRNRSIRGPRMKAPENEQDGKT